MNFFVIMHIQWNWVIIRKKHFYVHWIFEIGKIPMFWLFRSLISLMKTKRISISNFLHSHQVFWHNMISLCEYLVLLWVVNTRSISGEIRWRMWEVDKLVDTFWNSLSSTELALSMIMSSLLYSWIVSK